MISCLRFLSMSRNGDVLTMGDLIEREKVLEILRIIGHGRPISGKRAISLISEMPSSSMWIPCSERLPENRCGVIFTVDRGHPFVCVGYRINSERDGLKLQRWFDKLSGLNFSDYDVKAWMPMPSAYEQEKEDADDT